MPVLWPRWTVSCGGIDVPVSRLTLDQFATITAGLPGRALLPQLASCRPEAMADLHGILATAGVTLEEALSALPPAMHVNLHIVYPTADEERTLGLGPSADLNTFIDRILTVVFDHARMQRAQAGLHAAMRSLVFSSFNPHMCTALNWKQPNFPVFLCNDLGAVTSEPADALPAGGLIRSGGRRATSIKEVVRTAQSNNFMGLICCSRLLVSSVPPAAFPPWAY